MAADTSTPGPNGSAHQPGPRLYHDLASLWAAVSPPENYVEEVETFRRRFARHGVPEGGTVLHLGSGGGSIDFHLKRHYQVTGVDSSPEMIDQAREINPEVEYVVGDIREVRLGRTFDAVLVHDAIAYMTTTAELEAVYRTAAEHLGRGGVMVALPEEIPERAARPRTTMDTHMVAGRRVTVVETSYDPDPADHTFERVFVFLIHEGPELRVEVDRHIMGVFALEEFLDAMQVVGLTPVAERWELSDWGGETELPIVTAVRALQPPPGLTAEGAEDAE